MVEALISVIPFTRESRFSLIDLGCGTGTISKTVKDRFPLVDITCLDIAQKMLEIARAKLAGDVTCIQSDFADFYFSKKFDVIVSSLALHHLEDDQSKLAFYQKIYSALNENGIFVNIDVVLGSDDALQHVYMRKWQALMEKSVSKEEIAEKWLPNYYAEDWPTQLMAHLEMLKSGGFGCIDVIYKYFNYAVYVAKK